MKMYRLTEDQNHIIDILSKQMNITKTAMLTIIIECGLRQLKENGLQKKFYIPERPNHS